MIEQVRALALAGHNPRTASAEMGLTRNKVIGIAHRAGIEWGVRTDDTAADTGFHGTLKRAYRPRAPSPLLDSPIWQPLPGTTPVRLVDRDDRGCAWPVEVDGVHMFCNCPANPDKKALQYCDAHLVAYRVGSGS